MNTSRYTCCHTYKPQLVEHVRETYYGPHYVTLGWVLNTSIVRNLPRLSNSSASYQGGQSSGLIRMSHNSHTHTDNTRQSEPYLKDSLCSSAISSHNSRDVILSHNSRNVTCFSPIPNHNSRNTLARWSLRYHQRLVNHAKANKSQILTLHYRLALLQSH